MLQSVSQLYIFVCGFAILLYSNVTIRIYIIIYNILIYVICNVIVCIYNIIFHGKQTLVTDY